MKIISIICTILVLLITVQLALMLNRSDTGEYVQGDDCYISVYLPVSENCLFDKHHAKSTNDFTLRNI